jgi:hypothetical protein
VSINHKANCTHAQTPTARKACRKAARAAAPVAPVSYDAMKLGRGEAIHLAVRYDNGDLLGAKCGSGQYRGVRRQPAMYAVKGGATAEQVTCTKCAKHI